VGFLLLFNHVQIFHNRYSVFESVVVSKQEYQGQRISPVGKLSFKRIA